MKKNVNLLIISMPFLILSIVSAMFFRGTFSSDFTLFMGFGLMPVSLIMGIGFLAAWIFELFKKGRKAPVVEIVFFCSLIATAVISVTGILDLLYSSESFFPGLFGLILLIFALPIPAVITIITLILIIIKKCESKTKTKEKEDKNV